MGHSPGTKLGPYEIEAPIGAGGMGEVYRAKDTRLCREVAIEVLPNSLTQDGDRRLRRFEQEAKAVAALNHPNILGSTTSASRTVRTWNKPTGRPTAAKWR